MKLITEAALPIFLISTFFRFHSVSSLVFSVVTSILVVYGIILLIYSILNAPKNSLSTTIVALIILCALINMIFSENKTSLGILQLLGNLGFAWSVLYTKHRLKIYLALFIMLSTFFIYNILNNINPEDVFNVSRNFISVILLISISFYYFSCIKSKVMPNIMVSFAGLILAVWGIGRAGIASSALIFAGTLILVNKRTFIGLTTITLLTIGIVSSQTQIVDKLDIFYTAFERLDRLGTGGHRRYINSEYLTYVSNDNYALVFGAPLNRILSIVEVDGNPHNSYIRLHSLLGIFGMALIFITILLTVFKILGTKNYLLLIIFTASLLRSAFDSTAFYGPLDVIIFYCIFHAIQSKRIILRQTTPERGQLE